MRFLKFYFGLCAYSATVFAVCVALLNIQPAGLGLLLALALFIPQYWIVPAILARFVGRRL